MTVKSTVSFTDQHHQYAKNKAQKGESNSVSGVVAAGLELLIKDEQEREAAMQAMSESIKCRLSTPREEWLEGTNDLFAKARQRVSNK